MIRSLSILCLLLALVGVSVAQNEPENAQDEPEKTIDYFLSTDNFNVPLLTGNWKNQSTRSVAIFVHEALAARIQFQAVLTTNENEAFTRVLDSLGGNAFGEPIYTGRIGLLNGTWTERIYEHENSSLSIFALARSDRTFVASLLESSPDYSAVMIPIRNPSSNDTNPIDSLLEAYEDFRGLDAEITQQINRMFGDDLWTQVRFSTEDTGLMYQLGDFSFNLLVIGQSEDTIVLADGFVVILLGFFNTPDNSEYLYLGLGFSAIIMGGLLFTMVLRYRNAQKDFALLKEMTQ